MEFCCLGSKWAEKCPCFILQIAALALNTLKLRLTLHSGARLLFMDAVLLDLHHLFRLCFPSMLYKPEPELWL